LTYFLILKAVVRNFIMDLYCICTVLIHISAIFTTRLFRIWDFRFTAKCLSRTG